jgi:hypothetical protein
MNYTYSNETISRMNNTSLWNKSIIQDENAKTKNTDIKYQLWPTGDCDITKGRYYKQLSANLKITPEIIKKYNLLI